MRRPTISLRLLFALLSTGIIWAPVAYGTTLTVVGGQLVGATGVDVGGSLYDVSFVDDTCIALFSGCDSITDFAFTTHAEADVASASLLSQVFTGVYDSDPRLTNGCLTGNQCSAATTYDLEGSNQVNISWATNGVFELEDRLSSGVLGTNDDLADGGVGGEYVVYAVWTPVPEPGTVLLLSCGLALLSFRTRRTAAR